MTNMIFYILILGLASSFVSGAMRFSNINRAFILLQKGIMEYAVITCDDNNSPYYDQELLKKCVDDYCKKNIAKHTNKYTTSIYYINNDDSMCINGYCQAVKISLKADINYLFRFERAMTFTISSIEGGEV